VKTAVDSSVLLDVLMGDLVFGGPSREALREAYDRGALVACEVVWAEVRAQFAGEDVFLDALRTLGVAFEALTPAAAALAGQVWRDSRKAATRSRGHERVAADFLIGAHARVQAERLLTRDEAFYRTYFRGIKLASPEGSGAGPSSYEAISDLVGSVRGRARMRSKRGVRRIGADLQRRRLGQRR
jgi:predicted nucleic acid-binding protein